jgi:hypothetical protein
MTGFTKHFWRAAHKLGRQSGFCQASPELKLQALGTMVGGVELEPQFQEGGHISIVSTLSGGSLNLNIQISSTNSLCMKDFKPNSECGANA